MIKQKISICVIAQDKNFKKDSKFVNFFLAKSRQAVDFKINPSFKILRLLSLKVLPVEVISVIISEEPIKG